jgi:uncharacterized protein YdhG (YjbR/CyaY superfamily)
MNVDDYIASFPENVQEILRELRRTIRKAAPGAEETIRYAMPTVTLNGKYLVCFAAWKHHIGLYPVPALDEALEQEISPYRTGKDTVRLPLRKPIPYDLVERLVAILKTRSEAD